MTIETLSRSRGARVGLILFGTVIGLLACEIIVRVANIQPRIHVLYRKNFRLSENPVLQYELQPGSPDGKLRISSAGLRDREFEAAKPPGTYRIGIIGDSITYGLTCEQKQAFPKQLERLLSSAGPDATRFEVLNLGVSGYNISQIVARLRTQGMPFDPDLVIYAYSLNDPQTFSLELQGLTAMREEAREKFRPSDALRGLLSHSRLFLLAWQASQVQPWTRQVRPRHNSPDYTAVVNGEHVSYFEDLHRGESWELVRRGLSDLAVLSGDAGTPRILVATFPVFLGLSDPYPMRALHEKVLAEAQRQGLESLDLAPHYSPARHPDVESLFNDPFHPTPLGHLVAAYALLEWLRNAEILDEQGYENILSAHRADRDIFEH